MSGSGGGSPLIVAAGVAIFVLGLQLLSTLIPPLGDSIRQLPLIPIALFLITTIIALRLIRSR